MDRRHRTLGKVNLDLALVHYPVCNKNREIIGSAVTNLDIHDIARAGRTYGVDNYYLVIPYEDQRRLVTEIMDHWLTGHGALTNRDRCEAFSIVRVVEDLAGLYSEVQKKWGGTPLILATSARRQSNTIEFKEVRARISAGAPVLILFGTAWGLAPEVMSRVDGVLPPVGGADAYNHLAVRSAASIILDQLLGE